MTCHTDAALVLLGVALGAFALLIVWGLAALSNQAARYRRIGGYAPRARAPPNPKPPGKPGTRGRR